MSVNTQNEKNWLFWNTLCWGDGSIAQHTNDRRRRRLQKWRIFPLFRCETLLLRTNIFCHPISILRAPCLLQILPFLLNSPLLRKPLLHCELLSTVPVMKIMEVKTILIKVVKKRNTAIINKQIAQNDWVLNLWPKKRRGDRAAVPTLRRGTTKSSTARANQCWNGQLKSGPVWRGDQDRIKSDSHTLKVLVFC